MGHKLIQYPDAMLNHEPLSPIDGRPKSPSLYATTHPASPPEGPFIEEFSPSFPEIFRVADSEAPAY